MNTEELSTECGARKETTKDTNWHELFLPRKNAENAKRWDVVFNHGFHGLHGWKVIRLNNKETK
jgi:hypothetical protein